MRGLQVVIFLIFVTLAQAQTAKEFPPQNLHEFPANVAQVYKQVWKYNLSAAENLLKADDAETLAHIYVADKKSFIEVFATEDQAKFKTYLTEKEARLKKTEAGNKNSPFYFFVKAEIHLQSAILHLKFGAYSTAAWEINKALRLLKEGNSKYPKDLLLQRDLLIMQALVGTVPENYSWMLKMFGFEGELKPAMAKYAIISNAIKFHPDYKIFLAETKLLQSFLTQHLLNQPEEAWQLMEESSADFSTNPITAFARSNLAFHQKKNDVVIQILETYKKEIPGIPHLDYYQGIAKIQRGDDDAGFYLARYLKHFKGSNYIKDAYLKLGWAFLLNGDAENYRNSMTLVQRYGKAVLEEDKSALRESKNPGLPNKELLLARLLFDGGYFKEALSKLKNTQPENLTQVQQAEYFYRLGRIHESLDLNNSALQNYGTVIEKFSALQEYFAPAACYYSGLIWEKQNNAAKAKYFYKKCQGYKNYIYKNSFDQKALSGLRRLEN